MVWDGTGFPALRSGYGVGWQWMPSLEIWIWCGMALGAQPRDLGMVWDGTGMVLGAQLRDLGMVWDGSQPQDLGMVWDGTGCPASRSGYGVGWHRVPSLEIWVWCGMVLDAQP